MPPGSPTRQLDQLIDRSQQAQAELRKLIEGITPDDHGVVTTTADAAAVRADELRIELRSLFETGLAVASLIDDLHPQTSGAFDQLTTLAVQTESRLDRTSVGHADGALTSPANNAVDDESVPAVDAVADSTEGESGQTQYYGV